MPAEPPTLNTTTRGFYRLLELQALSRQEALRDSVAIEAHILRFYVRENPAPRAGLRDPRTGQPTSVADYMATWHTILSLCRRGYLRDVSIQEDVKDIARFIAKVPFIAQALDPRGILSGGHAQ